MLGNHSKLLAASLFVAATPALAQDGVARPTPLEVGRARSEALTSGGPRLIEHDMYYGLYSFSARANERVQVDMRSDAFDPLVELGRIGADGKFTKLAENDDADGLNARLIYTVPTSGDYMVRARSVGASNTGAYTVELRRLGAAPPPPAPVALRAGRLVRDSFTATAPTIAEEGNGATGRPYKLFTFDARAGQTYTINLRSGEFDTVLDVGAMTPIGFASARTNDDAEGEERGENSTDSQVVVRADRSGPLAIRASALGAATGAYEIEVK